MASESDTNSHDLLVAKCVAMACMFAATCLFGAIPFMLNYWFKWTDKGSNTRSAKVVTYLLYFGGGVLLATTFIHLLPEVQEVVEHLQECDQIKTVKFALPETLMCAGFFLMYLIEEMVHAYLHRSKKQKKLKEDDATAAFERAHSIRNSVLVKKRKTLDKDDEQDLSSTSTVAIISNNGVSSYSNANYHGSTTDMEEKRTPSLYEIPECNTADHTLQHSMENSHKPSLDHAHNYSHDHAHSHNGHGHSHMPLPAGGDGDAAMASSLRGLGIVLALSLHEVFEGLAIGLEDSTSSVWFLFAAVSAHKLVLAFCVSVELIVSRTRPILAVIYTITFAIVSPIGVAIGIAISHNSSDSEDSIVSMVLQGIACGTLLYVVFFEILSKQHAGIGAFIAMLIGFGVMFGLQNIGEGHGEDEHTCSGTVEALVNNSTRSHHHH